MPSDEAFAGQTNDGQQETRETQQAQERNQQGKAEKYQRMVREIGEYAIFMLDQNNVITSWNKGVHRVLGYTESEFIGQASAILFIPEDRAEGAPEKERDIAASTGQADDNRWHLKKDGSRFWVNGILTALHNDAGEPDGFVKVMRDNTKEKLADEALERAHDEVERRVQERTHELLDSNEQLRKSEQRFTEAFHYGPFAAVITTLEEDRFMEVNDAFSSLTGYSKEDVIGKTAKELGMWATREDQQKLAEHLKDGTGFRDLDLGLRTKDGDKRSILLSAAIVPNNGHDVLLKMFFDITERKQGEEELLRAIEEVMQDATWFSRTLVEKLAQVRSGVTDAPAIADLSPRERQVLIEVAKGRNNEQIAEALGLGQQTIRNYVASIYSKINVHSRVEAVVWARERGLL